LHRSFQFLKHIIYLYFWNCTYIILSWYNCDCLIVVHSNYQIVVNNTILILINFCFSQFVSTTDYREIIVLHYIILLRWARWARWGHVDVSYRIPPTPKTNWPYHVHLLLFNYTFTLPTSYTIGTILVYHLYIVYYLKLP